MANEMETTAKEPLQGSSTMSSLKTAFVSANNDAPFIIKLEESSDQVENSTNGHHYVKSHHPGMLLQATPNDDSARCIQVSRSSSLEVGNIISPRLDPSSVQAVFRKNTFHDTATTMTNSDSVRPFLFCNSGSSSLTSIPENFPWGQIPLDDIQTDFGVNMDEYYGYFVGLDDDEFSIEPIPLHALAAGAPVEADGCAYNAKAGNEDMNASLTLGTAVSSTTTEHENWPSGSVPTANNARLSSHTRLHVLATGVPVEVDDGDAAAITYLRALAAGVPLEPHGGDGIENGSGDSMRLDWGPAVLRTPTERETRPSDLIPAGHNAHPSSYRPPLPSTHPVSRAQTEKALRQAKKKATAAPVSTSRAPSTRKRKVQSSCNEERDSKKNKTVTLVGPDSTEMIAIKRMLIYLEETSSDVILVRSFHNIVEDSEKHHTKGRAKYKHLPGAIFERLIEQVGGEVFGPIYKASRIFEHERVKALYPQESASGSLDYENLTASGIGMPNLLQVAVGYGFHLARMSMLNHGHDICEDIEELMESGAETALNMKDDERFLFWKYMIDSQSVKEHLAGNF